MIRSHHGRTPQMAASAYIDPQAVVMSATFPLASFRGVWQ